MKSRDADASQMYDQWMRQRAESSGKAHPNWRFRAVWFAFITILLGFPVASSIHAPDWLKLAATVGMFLCCGYALNLWGLHKPPTAKWELLETLSARYIWFALLILLPAILYDRLGYRAEDAFSRHFKSVEDARALVEIQEGRRLPDPPAPRTDY